MIQGFSEPVQRLVESHYAVWEGVADLVGRWSELARTATQAAWAEVLPAGEGPIRAAFEAGAWTVEEPGGWKGDPEGTSSYPILYQGSELGRLALRAPAPASISAGSAGEAGEMGRELAKGLAFEVMRLELAAGARARFGSELPLVGPSPALRQVDRFVEQAARSVLPMLLVGDEGAETEAIALALHLSGERAGRRAVQVRCSILEPATLGDQLAKFARAAAGGTLILSRLDELAPGCQAQVCQLLDGEELVAEPSSQPPFAAPTWIATAPATIDESASRGQFYRPLLDRLDVLRLSIEPLNRRRIDVAYLFQHCFRHFAPARPLTLSADALNAFRSYPWPGDVAELRRVAARLAVLVDEEMVQIRHLRHFTPQIVATAIHPVSPALTPVPRLGPPPPAARPAPDLASPATPSALQEARHPSVRRALSFLLANYERKLSLAEVAGYAFVSASHLAHLFRQDLGTTVTQVLARVRIEQAKRLLVSLPWESITAVAGTVGFADLRHFERVFKMVEGCTPKEFRRSNGEDRPAGKPATDFDLRGLTDPFRSERN